MVELQLLGALHAVASDGRDLGALIAQPRRFALLAYLAAAAPHGFRRRDTLLSLFWPEADVAHARSALRKALHFLRAQLGPDVLVGRGDEEIGLAEQALRCDVAEFERALAERQLEKALGLYRGELLPGFFVSGAPAFERWLDEERNRLRVNAARAAWELAGQLETHGDRDGAARWGRWAHARAPDDELSLRHLVELLARLDDRVGAVHAYQEFACRLRREYDLSPSPGTRALLDMLRYEPGESEAAGRRASAAPAGPRANGGPPPADAASGASGPVVPPTHASTASRTRYIAVFPFSAHGEGAAYLEEGLVDLLSTNFDGAGTLRSVDPHALLSLVRRDEHSRIDPARAAALARQFGAELYVLGNVVGAAGKLRVSATLYDSEPGDPAPESVTHAGVEGPADQLFELVDTLTAKLLTALHGGLGARLTRLAAATTTSLPALKAYLAGESHLRAGLIAETMEAYFEAVRHDPTFALAWYRLAVFLSWPISPRQSLTLVEAGYAMQHKDRLSKRDRLLVEALYASLQGADDEGERLYREILAVHPEDVEAWIRLGEFVGFHNPQRGRLTTEARPAFERALALDPGNPTATIYLAYQAGLDGNRAEYDAHVERLGAHSDLGLFPQTVRAFWYGDLEARAQALATLRQAPDTVVYEAARFVAMLTHDFDAARRVAELLTEPTRSTELRAVFHVVSAFLAMGAGRPAAARRELTSAAEQQPAAALEYRALLAALPFVPVSDAELRDLRLELRAWDAAAVPPSSHPNPTFDLHRGAHEVLRLYLLGALSARLSDPAALQCAAELDTVSAPGPAEALARDLAHSVRAQRAWWCERYDAALTALDQTRVQPPRLLIVLQTPFYSQVLERWLRAEALHRLGRYDEALPWYQAVVQNSIYELPYLAPAHLRRAEVHDRLGDHDAAAHHYARFVELWYDCDAELQPFVANATSRLETLRGQGNSGRA
jgi:DNA-binding SARP family transcriptional activator/tetratricopeptide (TPR) repeat protein